MSQHHYVEAFFMVLQTQSFNKYNATQKVESTCSDQIEMYIDIIQIYWNMLNG